VWAWRCTCCFSKKIEDWYLERPTQLTVVKRKESISSVIALMSAGWGLISITCSFREVLSDYLGGNVLPPQKILCDVIIQFLPPSPSPSICALLGVPRSPHTNGRRWLANLLPILAKCRYHVQNDDHVYRGHCGETAAICGGSIHITEDKFMWMRQRT
jgi:hypothetical protein